MKWTMTGHACWLVESNQTRLMFDPLLTDPNQGGCYEVHPSRTINLAGMPRVDVIVITHRHLDHFDLPSLALLPRSAEVLCPHDNLIIEAVKALGFRSVVPLEEWQEVRYPGLSLTATRSENRVPEMGFLVHGSGSTVWNQVDTEVSAGVIGRARQTCGKIDLLIAPWQPLLELKFQLNQSVAFPHEAYADMLRFVRECGVSRVVPGACGFRYAGSGRWLNHVAFPVSRQRFVRDVLLAHPPGDLEVHAMDPGDILRLQAGGCSVERGAAGWVAAGSSEDARVMFCPVDPFGDMVNLDEPSAPPGPSLAAWAKAFHTFLQSSIRQGHPGLRSFVLAGSVYQLLVCGPDGFVAYQWDLGRGAALSQGVTAAATVVTMIDESLLLRLDAGELNWEFVFHTGRYRSFETVAKVSIDGYRRPGADEVVDPLAVRYPYQQGLEAHVLVQARRFGMPQSAR